MYVYVICMYVYMHIYIYMYIYALYVCIIVKVTNWVARTGWQETIRLRLVQDEARASQGATGSETQAPLNRVAGVAGPRGSSEHANTAPMFQIFASAEPPTIQKTQGKKEKTQEPDQLRFNI